MAVFFWYFIKSDLFSVRYIHVYTGKVNFAKYERNTAMFNWSPCTKYQLQEISIWNEKYVWIRNKNVWIRSIDLNGDILDLNYDILDLNFDILDLNQDILDLNFDILDLNFDILGLN